MTWKPGGMKGLLERLEKIRDLFEQINEVAIQQDKEKIEKIIKLYELKNDMAKKQVNNSNH